MQQIANEKGLPATGIFGRSEYVRSKCDPTVLIGCKTGECFQRTDGARWEWPAYVVDVDASERKSVEPWTCIEDAVVYDPKRGERTEEHKGDRQKQKRVA